MTGISTRLIHGADELSRVPDVVSPINISTTFKYNSDPDQLVKIADHMPQIVGEGLYYSRLNHPNSEQVEASVGSVTGGHVVAYSSGLSAFYAALTYFNPKVLGAGQVYHGNVGIANIFTRNYGLKQVDLKGLDQLSQGDLVLLETPVNPNGTVFNIQEFADKAHAKGAFLLVDSTFAPPPLQDPFKFGADMILHSATKFFGGHSDLLAGFLITKSLDVKNRLLEDRLCLGTIVASLESSLLLRSLRTFELRVLRQSESATKLVRFLVDNKERFPVLAGVQHGSLQTDAYIKHQLPNGHSPVFTITLVNEQAAKTFPSRLKYFIHATSLGGVESLIEWRAMSDQRVTPTLLRVSVGVESVEDLIEDFTQGLTSLSPLLN